MTDLAVAALFAAVSLVLASLEPGTAAARGAGAALLAFWMAAAFRVGRTAAARIEDDSGEPARLLSRSFLHAFFFVIVVILALAAARALRLIPVALVFSAAYVAAGRLRPPAIARPGPGALLQAARRSPPEAIGVGVAVTLAALNCGWGLLSPVAYTDDMSYHLVFPAEWMQTGTLSLKAVPFGNHSPTYHPKNVEAVYAWALLALRELFPLVAFSFLWTAAGVLALHDTFRRLGAGARASVAAASLFALSPVVSRQSACGCVDIPFSVFLILSVNAMLAFRARPSLGRWLELCIAVGAFLGTKMFGLPLLAVFLAPVFLVLLPWRRLPSAGGSIAGALAGAAAATAAGGWWYLRNAWLTGNPVFPVTVQAFGRTIFPGAYLGETFPDSEALTILELAPLPVRWLLAAGVAVTLAAVAARALRSRAASAPGPRPGAAAFVGIALPAGTALLLQHLIPLDEERFVLAAYGLAGAVLLVPLERLRGARGGFAWLVAAAVAAVFLLPAERASVVLAEVPRLLAHSPLTDGAWILASAAFLAAAALAAVRLPRPAVVPAVAAAAGLGFAALSLAARTSDPFGPYATSIPPERWTGARFVDGRGGGLRIAATGHPSSLALYGRRLDNVVRYVNVNDTPGDLFHDHVMRWPERRDRLREDRKGIGWFRSGASYEAWLRNLEAFGPDLVVTFRLPRHALNAGFERDRDGFPQETIWAEAHPERFRSLLRDPEIRVFELLPPDGGAASRPAGPSPTSRD